MEKGEGWNSSEREICLEGEESVVGNGGAEINFEEILDWICFGLPIIALPRLL